MCRNPREQALLQTLVGSAARVDVQSGRGLGAALHSAFDQGMRDGAASVAVLGSDSPTLPHRVIDDAFAALECGADVSLGPAEDGGYYLLAASALHSGLFSAMPWSTDVVASLTITRCAEAGLRTHQLPVWYDVDDANSLGRLEAELRVFPRDVAIATREAFASCAPGGLRKRDRFLSPLGRVHD
jgi:glycosyltransferase A (GT-A) superfamily protein (DUF2064 family)